jgi:toxin ParE1/3/4
MADYRLSRLAQRDLDRIFDYTVAQWGLTQAMRYTDLIELSCAELAIAPQQAKGCAYIRPGYRLQHIGHHVIYFRQTSYGIAIVRILHERMDAARHIG